VNVGLKVSNALQGRLVHHLLGLDQRFFLDNAPGALIERVRGDTHRAAEARFEHADGGGAGCRSRSCR
jgi:hypothetical protein